MTKKLHQKNKQFDKSPLEINHNTMSPYPEDNVETKTSIEKLAKYKKSIEFLAKEKSDFIFENADIDHGQLVLSTIFKYSTKEVIIKTDNISGDIADYEECKINIEKFLKEDKGSLKIITDKIVDTSEFFIDLKSYKKDGLDVSILLSSDQIETDLTYTYNYYAIGDDRMIRLISNVEANEAICSFNRPKYAKIFSERFISSFDSKSATL